MFLEKKMNTDLFWMGDHRALKGARSDANTLRSEGNTLAAHCVMLSAYYSLVGSVSPLKKVLYFLLMSRHASVLYENWSLLTHNQLDVLLQFYVRAHQKSSWLSPATSELFKLVGREIAQARKVGKPHQIALAYTTKAQVARAAYNNHNREADLTPKILLYRNSIFEAVNSALGLICQEEQSVNALRQFVRVLKYCGEVLIGIDNRRARGCLLRGLELAKGDADTPDQVRKIQAILDTL